MSDLRIEKLVKNFAAGPAVDAVSFEVPSGSFFSILGPSGCGKTTLLRMIAGFAEPDSGAILIGNKDMVGVPPNKRPVNLVFQTLALFPTMSVGENIAYGLNCRGEKGPEVAKKVDRVLERVHLGGFAARRVDQLSGGQRQRVALARCLVLDPAVLLLDEPLGALDLKLREEMKLELKQLQHAFHTTFVYITHDQSEALAMSDQVAVMNKGRFEQVGSPQDLYHHPKTAFVAGFVGDTNRFKGTIDHGGAKLATPDWGDIALPAGYPAGPSDVFVRPEAIQVAFAEEDLSHLPFRRPVTVEATLFDGAQSRLLVKGGAGATIRVALPPVGPISLVGRGAALWIGWAPSEMRCFPDKAA